MSRSLAIHSSNSPPELNARWEPVTRFSRRPASAFGFASLRTFTTYARRVGYFDSGLSDIVRRRREDSHRCLHEEKAIYAKKRRDGRDGHLDQQLQCTLRAIPALEESIGHGMCARRKRFRGA